jgi:hypothetical protein
MSRGPHTDGHWNWSAPTHYPRKTDDKAWPQSVGLFQVQSQTERDLQERLQQEADDISETTGYGETKERKRQMISPPSTPPLNRGQTDIVGPLQASATKIKKVRAKRSATRRPVTRSLQSRPRLFLHECKGYVYYGLLAEAISFEEYLQNHVNHPTTWY